MKNPITKLAVAAAIIAAVVLGLFEFIGTGTTSGVVWADVARKVQASQGVIFRAIQHTAPPSHDDKVDFSMSHYSSTKARLDRYKGGQIVNTMYDNCATKTVVLVDHIHKSYVQDTNAEDMPSSFQMADPNSIIQRFLGCEHRELGRKTIEGVLCEGIETTDPAFHGGENPPESLAARIWVSVETGYPVRIEAEYARESGQRRLAYVQDQFQWDVELDESLFEPNVPAGYIDISPDEW
jgi:outer membrane lipoprotein-sorting protein